MNPVSNPKTESLQGLVLAKTHPEQLSTNQRETITIIWPISLHGLQGAGDLDNYIQFSPSQARQIFAFIGMS